MRRDRPFFGVSEDLLLKNILRKKYISDAFVRSVHVDVIMPTFNRSLVLSAAIQSIRAQLHRRWRLFVCDDGSTDNTYEILRLFDEDKRINYIKLPHRGVSHARNAGLYHVTGGYISYLDSDNTWSPEYLSLMLSFMHSYSLDCAYCAAKLRSETSQKWLGDYFSWQDCVEQNYIDINCFMLKSSYRNIMFDESLERFVDWDYILTVTRDACVSYFPVPLVDYDDHQSARRITTQVYQNENQAKYLESIRMKHDKLRTFENNIDVRLNP